MELNKITVDHEREQSGTWVEYDAETKFKLASVNSRKYRKAYQEALEELRRVKRKFEPEDTERLTAEVFAKTIIVGWSGVTLNGAEYPYTAANAEYILLNCPNVREFIYGAANNFENFRLEAKEEAKAALGETSVGT